jgi:hypothetical protein
MADGRRPMAEMVDDRRSEVDDRNRKVLRLGGWAASLRMTRTKLN